MKLANPRPESLTKTQLSYCAGCGHGVAHRLVAEVLDELGVRERTVGVAPVGCAVFAYDYWNFDVTEAPHGRTPCVAAGIKRVLPDRVVFSYQGDGDLASIGMGEIVHTANRGENITVVFINNANYGMTGGQMAPTTLLGMRTTTTPLGRSTVDGHPFRVPELLNALEAPVYLDRQSLHDPLHVRKAKASLKKAFQLQVLGKGFALVELLSACPANWGMTPADALKWVGEHMVKTFPLGVVRDKS
jgi:2-oxoglutarate/2-oxoacid ferredoxin oxidoreductase subunit beta